MQKLLAVSGEDLIMSLLVRGVVLVALCVLVSGCTAGASQWESTYGSVPIKPSKTFEYIGPY